MLLTVLHSQVHGATNLILIMPGAADLLRDVIVSVAFYTVTQTRPVGVADRAGMRLGVEVHVSLC
jgi:hypothetical protein